MAFSGGLARPSVMAGKPAAKQTSYFLYNENPLIKRKKRDGNFHLAF